MPGVICTHVGERVDPWTIDDIEVLKDMLVHESCTFCIPFIQGRIAYLLEDHH